MKLDTNSHSVFLLHYHLILVVKYRRKIITRKILNEIKNISERIGGSFGVTVTEFNGESDHVHFLLKTKPNCDLSKYINAVKSATSRIVKKNNPEIVKQLWNGAFWSNSYCLITSGGAPIEVLKGYIQSQAEFTE